MEWEVAVAGAGLWDWEARRHAEMLCLLLRAARGLGLKMPPQGEDRTTKRRRSMPARGGAAGEAPAAVEAAGIRMRDGE